MRNSHHYNTGYFRVIIAEAPCLVLIPMSFPRNCLETLAYWA
jgi:hypothetical protein